MYCCCTSSTYENRNSSSPRHLAADTIRPCILYIPDGTAFFERTVEGRIKFGTLCRHSRRNAKTYCPKIFGYQRERFLKKIVQTCRQSRPVPLVAKTVSLAMGDIFRVTVQSTTYGWLETDR